MGELLDVEPVDSSDLLDLASVTAVMGQTVMCFRHASFVIDLVAEFERDHEGDDAGHVGLEGDRHQVEHEPGMRNKALRHTGSGPRQFGRRHVRVLLGLDDPLLDVPYRKEVFVQLAAVGGTERALQRLGLFQHKVQHALVVGSAASATGRVGIKVGPAEHALEDRARTGLLRHRGRGRAPRNRVAVGAAVAAVAVAAVQSFLAAELQ